METLLKAALTAGTVWLVLRAARQAGRHWAGLAAALPTITAPTLGWLAHEAGVGFAIHAAIGSVAACAMLAVFALGYARAARLGGGVLLALGCGVGAALALSLPARLASGGLGPAVALALGCCAAAWLAMPGGAPAWTGPQRTGCPPVLIAVVAGLLTALAARAGPALGGFVAGLLSSLPLITGPVAMVEHRSGGHPAVAHFLRAYVGGLLGKVVFGAVFALLAARTGAAAALLLACACSVLLLGLGGPLLLRPGRQAAPAWAGAGLRRRG